MNAWRVFGQSESPRLASADWTRHAKVFFGVTLVVSDPAWSTFEDQASASIAIDDVTRALVGRARIDEDLRDALAADTGGGLYDLAERRCPTVWLVAREGASDHIALTIAAVIASVALGPILGDGALFGVRTAREKLAAIDAPYR